MLLWFGPSFISAKVATGMSMLRIGGVIAFEVAPAEVAAESKISQGTCRACCGIIGRLKLGSWCLSSNLGTVAVFFSCFTSMGLKVQTKDGVRNHAGKSSRNSSNAYPSRISMPRSRSSTRPTHQCPPFHQLNHPWFLFSSEIPFLRIVMHLHHRVPMGTRKQI